MVKLYNNQDYAEQLAHGGELRMWSQSYYKTLEDARGDPAEGESHLLVPGLVPVVGVDTISGEATEREPQQGHFDFRGSFINPTYLFCTSHPSADLNHLRSGPTAFLVRILDPRRFAESLFQALVGSTHGDRKLGFLDGCPVRYDKGEVGSDFGHPETRLRIHFAQKSRFYEREHEYRFTASLSGAAPGSPDYLTVKIASPDGLFDVERV
ncbi:MAG: hypothetical protein ABMA15_28950 [Vicinamibacterales bacterium]